MSDTYPFPPSGFGPRFGPDFGSSTAGAALTDGVLGPRCLAWLVDAALIACLTAAGAAILFAFGLLTLGLGMPLLGLLPAVPFGYRFVFLAGMAATPGQALCGLRVLRAADLGRPTPPEALVSVLLYYVTLATGGLLLLVALVNPRHRTLHDILSGLLVVRAGALRDFPAAASPMPFRA